MIATILARVDPDVLRTDECWVVSSTERYARVFLPGGRGKRGLAHRLAYEALVGTIPDGLTIDASTRPIWSPWDAARTLVATPWR